MTDTPEPRGRKAAAPRRIPMLGWKHVAIRVKNAVLDDNLSLVAAGVALYSLLAVVPGLTAFLAVYGLIVSPEQAVGQIRPLTQIMPPGAAAIIQSQLDRLASREGIALGWGAAVSLLIALWGSRRGISALMIATNIAYGEEEERGFFRQTLLSLALTVTGIVGFMVVMATAVVFPIVLEVLGVDEGLQRLGAVLRWLFLWCFVVAGLAAIYRFGPDRHRARWRWVSWGSAIAALLWVLGSVLFALYVRRFGQYGEAYGALGGVVVLLLWFFLSAFVVVLGAEINSEIEHQTGVDSTVGEKKPMGKRGAHVADTLGKSPP